MLHDWFSSQAAEKVPQRRSRIAQRLNVPPGKSCSKQLGVGRVKKDTPRLLRHRALTNSRPSADVTLIMLRVADLAAALLDGHFEHPNIVTLVTLSHEIFI
jgi:hypothetical protein